MDTDIIEGNKAIAEFMDEDLSFPYDYHVSFDWLMPVVERIEHCDDTKNDRGYSFHVCIFDKDCHIYEYMNDDEQPPIFMEEGKTKLEAVWLAVIEFIKWKNKNE